MHTSAPITRAAPQRLLLALALAGVAFPAMAVSPLEGHWVGIFESGKDKTFAQTSFAEKDQKLSGELKMPANDRPTMALAEVQDAKGKVSFQLAGPDGVLQFDGKLKDDTLSGIVGVAGKTPGKFTFQRSLAPSMERDQRYLGAYKFDDGRVVVLSHLGDFPQLFYTDFKSGRYGAMFPSGEREFYTGTGFLNLDQRELKLSFQDGKDGKPARMVWQAPGQRPQTAQRLALRSEDVTFKNGDVTLSGTVVLPEKKSQHAAVVLTQMSSPAPRGAYALQAYYFAAHGMAALMFDKRGVGSSTGDWQKATMQDLADDAVAGIKLMAAHPEIDPKKIGTWGHSQGGWLAPLAATRSGQAAFVIAQAASGVTPAEQEIYRIENTMRVDGYSDQDIKAAVAYQRLLMHWVVSGGEGRTELLAAARAGDKERWAERVELLPDTMRAKPREDTTTFYNYDPLPDLSKLTAPVLYILGERDSFVPVHKSEQLFKRTLADAKHPDYQVWMLPNAEHGLWELPHKGPNAFIDARFWAREHYPRMTEWLTKRGFLKH